MTKTAFTAIVGKPNVGKSSLLNKMLGAKVAIVSSKPQTTRTKITGVLTRGETQFVFTDTPGFHKPHNKLGEAMNNAVGDSIGGTDAVVFVTEPYGELTDKEFELIKKFKQEKAPVILVINKIDAVKDKKDLLGRIAYLSGLYDFSAVVPASAVNGNGIDALLGELEKIAVESVHFFPDDTLTDQPERVLAAEIILPGNPAHWHLVPLCGSIEPRALHLVDRHHVLARDIIGDFLAGVWLRRFIGSRNRLFCVVSLRFCISLPEFC